MWRPSTPCPRKNCPRFCPVQLVNFEWLAVHSYTQALCSDSCCRALRQQLLEISKAGWLAGSLSRWDRNQQHRPLEKWHFWRCKGTIFPRWGMMFQGFPRKPFFPRWDMLIYVDLWVPWRVKELSLVSCDCSRKSHMSFWQPFDLQQQSCPGAPGEWKQMLRAEMLGFIWPCKRIAQRKCHGNYI